MSRAWIAASADLGIRVVAPASITLKNGHSKQVEAHILDFGSPKGALAISELSRMLDSSLFEQWSSILMDTYERYDRQLFVDTLDDWGWFGDRESVPDWYSGAVWGHKE
jgi:hypothetical protein